MLRASRKFKHDTFVLKMSTTFNDYEEDFNKQRQECMKAIEAADEVLRKHKESLSSQDLETAGAAIRKARELNTEHLESILQQMQYELTTGLRADQRSFYEDKFTNEYQKAVKVFHSKIHQLDLSLKNAKITFLENMGHRRGGDDNNNEGGGVNSWEMTEAGKKQLKQQKEQLQRVAESNTEILRGSLRELHHIHEDANAITSALSRDKDKLYKIKGTARGTDQELGEIGRILRGMHKEMMKNKLTMTAIIAFLVLMIVSLLYYKFGGPGSRSNELPAYTGAAGDQGSGTAPLYDNVENINVPPAPQE